MKVATTSTPTDFAALNAVDFVHTADFESIELEAKKRHYARLYARYLQLMEMEVAGITVTVTLTSPAGTLTIENDQQFEPMDYLNTISTKMRALADELLDLTQAQQQGKLNGGNDEERADNALRRQAHALCLPTDYTPATLATPLPPAAQAA